MDWSSMYEDDAATSHDRSKDEMAKLLVAASLNEEVEIGETRSTRAAHQLMSYSLSRSLSFNPVDIDPSASGYTPLVAYSFTVNYILGVGSLGVPYALYKAGVVFGSILLILVSFISYVTVMWVSEATARVRDMDAKNSKTKLLRDPFHFPEVTTLCDRFMGVVGAALYQVSLLGLMYGGLLGYSQVFVNSVVSQLPSTLACSSTLVAVVFGLVVVPLSCVDLNEQIHVQVVMAIVRFVALTTMIVSAFVALFVDSQDSGTSSPISQGPPYASDVPWINLDSFGLLFSTTVFSQLFQHSVPGLLAPLARKDQPKAPSIFGYALLTTTCFYLALSLSCCYYFGPKISSSVNLNWASFSWGIDGAIPIWAKFLSLLVVLFPALDTLSVFPLIAITLGDNLAASLKGRVVWLNHKRLVCRLIASIPPLIVAVLVTDLSVTLQFSGIFGLYVAFITPALLQLFSQREDPRPNVYSGRFSSEGYIFAVLGFGGVALIIAIVQVVYNA
ncbi:hypothetical protein H310_06934 [Aphanomyces invadans]|uniref:Amino acid transporter transmembrane domain-containing protein n=1 Tax=Aphanomyces invadans TaxID=157072 RepID=A0A024U584_9STRA|nr:hypothetical protein H310_06934 [Aphanomyces invadans]ETW01385.1 hypothetical protein H310_06934 [Aphanomyces invadans]|eukprot:XP_008870383.1 hypothetical protein H310_06934 [Aphanomyces invadans]